MPNPFKGLFVATPIYFFFYKHELGERLSLTSASLIQEPAKKASVIQPLLHFDSKRNPIEMLTKATAEETIILCGLSMHRCFPHVSSLPYNAIKT